MILFYFLFYRYIFLCHFNNSFHSFCRITLIAKLFEGKTDLVEEWYGTEYSVNKISHNYIEVTS